MSGLLPDLSLFIPALRAAATVEAPNVADAIRPHVPRSARAEDGQSRETGTAAASLVGQETDTATGASITVYSDDPIVGFLVNGTVAHVITAKHYLADGRLGYLRFEPTSGGVMYRHQVFHPGTAPIDLVGPAEGDINAVAEAVIGEAWQAVMAS